MSQVIIIGNGQAKTGGGATIELERSNSLPRDYYATVYGGNIGRNGDLNGANFQSTLAPAVQALSVACSKNTPLAVGFRSFSLETLDGRLLPFVGESKDGPGETSLALAKVSAEDAALHWNGELMLRTSMPIASVGVPFTRLHLSRRLSTVQAQLFDLRGLGKTGEIGLCAGRLRT